MRRGCQFLGLQSPSSIECGLTLGLALVIRLIYEIIQKLKKPESIPCPLQNKIWFMLMSQKVVTYCKDVVYILCAQKSNVLLQCSGLTPGSTLKDHSHLCSGNYIRNWGLKLGGLCTRQMPYPLNHLFGFFISFLNSNFKSNSSC